MIKIKNKVALDAMRESGRMSAALLGELCKAVAPGVTTEDLDQLAGKIIKDFGAKSSFLNYHGYPKNTCISINDEIIHGIPSPTRVINLGDVVSIDVGVFFNGYHGDNAETVIVGEAGAEMVDLLATTRAALDAGIAAACPGKHLSDVSAAVEKVAREGKAGIVRDFVGHGIGKELHEEPQVPNYGKPGRGPILQEGMVFCIEPMLTRKSARNEVLENGWTVVTCDGSYACHCEHMIAITSSGCEILTPRTFKLK